MKTWATCWRSAGGGNSSGGSMSADRNRQVIFALAVGGAVVMGVDAQSSGTAPDLTGLDCMIEPHSVADVSTREEGVLEQVLVKRGDIVKKGQVVAKLESALEKIAFEFASARAAMQGEISAGEAKLEYMRRQRQRIGDLYKDQAISFNDQDKAETDVRLAETELQVARDNHALM